MAVGRKCKEYGFSLVELLVALTIGSLLAAGVLHFSISNSRSFRLQQDIIHIQERTRFVTRYLEHQIRMADHWGSVSFDQRVGDLPDITAKGDCDKGWAFDGSDALLGYEGASSISSLKLPKDCVKDVDYVGNSDVFTVRYASDQPLSKALIKTDQIYWEVTANKQGQFVKGEDIDTTTPDSTNVLYYPYEVSMFVIRPCYVTSGNEECNSTDDGGEPIPTLVRYYLDEDEVKVERIMEGVEQMQLEYGVSLTTTDATGATQTGMCWLEADEMSDIIKNCGVNSDAVLSWSNVSFMRFSIIVRSREKDISQGDFSVYPMLRDDQKYTPSEAARNFRRKHMVRTVKLRNRFLG